MKSVPRSLPVLMIAGAVLLVTWAAAAAPVRAPKTPASNVSALLKSRCGGCHSPTLRKGDLDLTTPEGVAKGGEGGPVLVPGKPEESRLLKVIVEGKMPPKGLPRLSPTEVNAIRAWIVSAKVPVSPPVAELSQHRIVPLMALRCTVCHGLRRQEGGLDLRTRVSMLKGGKSGPAVVLGKPEESLVLKRIHAGEMPPPRELVSVSVKPMEPTEIDLLSRWIAAGAPEVEIKPDVPGAAPDPLVTDADRRFWAFRAPEAAAIPKTKLQTPNPIDAFLLQDLEKKGLTFAPPAERATLIRRATYDLIGLPPTPEEVAAFLADKQPGAYERLIDRLLASPRYGERWARKWMDLAGYSDTEGIQDGDPARPFNWRYRDYLIRAFNADKPYDRFILEQIAGDELADYEKGPVTQEIADNLTATGFLRQTVDATFAGITGFVPDRLDVIADEVNVLGSSIMGLTLKCARCHTHKFDPIPHRDYFRLTDIFKGALDENDWLSPQLRTANSVQGSRHLPYVPAAERAAWEKHEADLDAELTEGKKPVEALLAKLHAAGEKGDEEALKARHPELLAAVKERDRIKRDIDGRRKPMPVIRALWDRGAPSPTYVYQRGDYLRPSVPISPGVPSVLTDGKTPFVVTPPWPGAKQTGRRLAFARWLVRPDHPLTARVIVNRVWKHHFGRGIVTTLDNFGKTGARPTHPELLDTLSVLFTAETPSGRGQAQRSLRGTNQRGLGWSLKSLHRMMMLSRAYRQSSHPGSSSANSASLRLKSNPLTVDPENRLLWHMPLRRLEAEEMSDSLLAISGRLDLTQYGPPDELDIRGDGLVRVKGTAKGWRRAVYSLQKRKAPITLLESFDLPPMGPNCVDRPVSTVATQALHLLNDAGVRQLAGEFAARVKSEAAADRAGQVERACRLAWGRDPSASERREAVASLAELEAEWRGQGKGVEEASRLALADYCLVLFNSAAFLYID